MSFFPVHICQVFDYGLCIRTGDGANFRHLFNLLHIVFAIFQNTQYLDAMGLQQLHFLYLEEIKHPVLRLITENFRSFVGEDIELANRALGQSVASVKGRSDVEHLTNAYQQLGVMLHRKTAISEQIAAVRSMKTWTSNKKLRYTKNDVVIGKTTDWFRALFNSFREGTFKHYQIPDKVAHWLEESSVLGKRSRTKSFQGTPTGTRDYEQARLVLLPFPYILNYD